MPRSFPPHREAIAHFNQGLAQIDLMPDTPERRRRELALRLALAVSITTTSGYANPEAYRVYARARTLAEQAGDGADSFQAIYGLWRYAVIGAHLDEAEALGRQLMELAAGLHDAGLRVEAHRAMGVNHFHVGDFAAARPTARGGDRAVRRATARGARLPIRARSGHQLPGLSGAHAGDHRPAGAGHRDDAHAPAPGLGACPPLQPGLYPRLRRGDELPATARCGRRPALGGRRSGAVASGAASPSGRRSR